MPVPKTDHQDGLSLFIDGVKSKILANNLAMNVVFAVVIFLCKNKPTWRITKLVDRSVDMSHPTFGNFNRAGLLGNVKPILGAFLSRERRAPPREKRREPCIASLGQSPETLERQFTSFVKTEATTSFVFSHTFVTHGQASLQFFFGEGRQFVWCWLVS